MFDTLNLTFMQPAQLVVVFLFCQILSQQIYCLRQTQVHLYLQLLLSEVWSWVFTMSVVLIRQEKHKGNKVSSTSVDITQPRLCLALSPALLGLT